MNGGFYDKQRRGGMTASGTLLLCGLLVLPSIALLHLAHEYDPRCILGYVLLVSLVTYLLYRKDKANAESGRWRTPESTLHFLELIGGWGAAFIAQRNFRHKTSKLSFQATFWAIVLLHEVLFFDYLRGWKLANQVVASLTQQ